ncbi:MAG: fibronectin type III domain-containing protein [Clostridiales bacterium]|nr:fibronectin type III domain-containing protein [Clostridiales bacterium]
MKKWLGFVTAVACLCLLFLGNTVSAAEVSSSVDDIAYVDVSAKRLVLKYEDFSSSGYTYTVTNTATGDAVASGSVDSGKSRLNINLGDNYSSDTQYKLVLTGSNGDTLTVNYLTAQAVGELKATKKSDNSMLTSWTVSSTSTYDGYYVLLTSGSSSPTVKVSATATSGSSTSKSIASSKLSNMTYTVHLISYKKVGGTIYCGQGLTTSIDYVVKPGKVTGVTVTAKTNGAKLTWNKVSGATYYNIYKCKTSSGTYKSVKTKVTGTSATVTGLSAGKNWYFKVVAVTKVGSTKATGAKSSAVKTYVPVDAGKGTGLTLTQDSNNNLAIKWNKTSKATGYRIYYKKKTGLTYQKLGSTKKTTYSLTKLDADTKYNIYVVAYTTVGSKKYLSNQTSKTLTVKPSKYLEKNYYILQAKKVRTIGYSGSKCIYTTKKYSTEVKEAFVNYKGYSSKTKYLIWISHYTQQVSIFKGSKGNWKMIRTFICATGTASNHSPIGVYKITYKESGWYYTNSKELYVTHWCGRNSFHTRPLYNDGTVKTATIGKPASHGCVRCYNQDAKYIYDNMPIGTTVVSY